MTMNGNGDQPLKDYEVGYGRPPVEHRFKKGQKPPARKRRRKDATSPQVLLWQILNEQKRVELNGEVRWLSASEIIIRKAFALSDAGSSTIQRLLTAVVLAEAEGEGDEQPRIETNPEAEVASIWTERRRIG